MPWWALRWHVAVDSTALSAHVQLAEHLLVGEVFEPLGPLADFTVGQTGGQAVDILRQMDHISMG